MFERKTYDQRAAQARAEIERRLEQRRKEVQAVETERRLLERRQEAADGPIAPTEA